ncbi:MAG: hypothetical protein RL653_733 [Pseudomonadota bacterium]
MAQLVLLVGAAAWGALFQVRLSGVHVPDTDYEAAAQVLAREARPGDVVLLYPWWTERARLFVPAGLPAVGHLHSDEEPLEDHPRVWLLSVPGLPRADLPDFERTHMKDRARVGDERRLGKLSLSPWNNGLYRPARFSAASELGRAQAWVESPDGTRAPCGWNGRAFSCPGELFATVGWHEVDQVPRRCLFVRPGAGGAKLVLEWPEVSSSPGDALVLEGGVAWESAVRAGPEHGDVTARAEAPGTPPVVLVAKEGVEAFGRSEGPAPSSAGPLRLSLSAPGGRDRDSCLGLFVRAPRGAP